MRKPRLPDGHIMRPLEDRCRYNQVQMFALKIPRSERIMNVREIDDALNTTKTWRMSGAGCWWRWNRWWRTSRYGVYARGFEKELDKPVGSSVMWIEDNIPYIFEVPDVRHPADPDKGLRQASGMLDFPLAKLRYDEKRRTVSVAPDFDPEADVKVVDIMRPSLRYGLTDAAGYPLRTEPSVHSDSEARISDFRAAFDGEATGWHGSVVRGIDSGVRHEVTLRFDWYTYTGVALIRYPKM